jgi:cell fate (sporulation/competence/biofilm development) regulator YlbF (YheA/YmcA/DUF963 family)
MYFVNEHKHNARQFTKRKQRKQKIHLDDSLRAFHENEFFLQTIGT